MITPHLKYETELWSKGREFICGIDEAGRGCIAGPLYVGAVIFKKNCNQIEGVRDSKLLTAKARERLSKEITKVAAATSVGFVTHEEIDGLGLTKATKLATARALKLLAVCPEVLLIDAFGYEDIETISIIKGDQVCYSISAASIIAKVERDAFISAHPEALKYGFKENKGYGTKDHLEKLKRLGPSSIHRRSFAPLREQI